MRARRFELFFVMAVAVAMLSCSGTKISDATSSCKTAVLYSNQPDTDNERYVNLNGGAVFGLPFTTAVTVSGVRVKVGAYGDAVVRVRFFKTSKSSVIAPNPSPEYEFNQNVKSNNNQNVLTDFDFPIPYVAAALDANSVWAVAITLLSGGPLRMFDGYLEETSNSQVSYTYSTDGTSWSSAGANQILTGGVKLSASCL